MMRVIAGCVVTGAGLLLIAGGLCLGIATDELPFLILLTLYGLGLVFVGLAVLGVTDGSPVF